MTCREDELENVNMNLGKNHHFTIHWSDQKSSYSASQASRKKGPIEDSSCAITTTGTLQEA